MSPEQELLPPPPKKNMYRGEELLPLPPKKKENLGSNDLPTPSVNGLSSTPKVDVVVHTEQFKQIEPIEASLMADELNKKTKIIEGLGDRGTEKVVQDEEAKKEAKLLKDEIKVTTGFDADELAAEHKGLTANDYGKEGFSKEELLTDKRENPQLYQRKLGRLKWQSGFESVLADNLVNGNMSKETYDGLNHAIESSLSHASVGDYVQQRENINYVANAIKQYGGEKRDELLKNYAIEVGKVYGNSYKSQSQIKPQEKPEDKYLNSDAQLGLQYLKDVDPEKAQQYYRLFIDPKTIKDKPDERKGYNHLMQTLEETGLGLKENAVNEDLNNLSNIAKRNDGLTPEQLEQAKVLEAKKEEIIKAKNELDNKYPERLADKADDAMQEILGQKIGWGNYAGGMAGKAFKNTAQGIWEAVSEPFMSDASNRMRELAIMGEALDEEQIYHKTDANKNFQTDTLMIKPELQAEIDLIKNDKSLTREQKEAKLYPLLYNNSDKYGRVPIQGGKFNINPSSILYGITDIGTTLLPFIALEAATGSIGGVGTAAKFLRTFTAAAATTFHDEYAHALLEGKPQSEAYKQAMGMTAIGAAGMAGAGTAEKVRAFYSGAKSSAAKIIESMSDDAIEFWLRTNKNKSLKFFGGIAERILATPKMFAKGAKTGAEFEVAMTAANELKHQIYNNPIDREQNFKQSLLGIANFGILGAGLGHIGYKSPTELQKSGFSEMGKNPEEYKLVAQQMLKDGQLTKEEFDHRTLLIEKSAEAVKTLPKANAKGKPLSEKEKADYIYNSVIKNEGKKSASNLPPKQAEKAEHTAMVADFKNDLILEPKTDTQLESTKNKLEKVLEPKKDENGKPIELNEKVEKETKAELAAVKEVIEEKSETPAVTEPTQPSTEVKNEVMYHSSKSGELGDFNSTPIFFSKSKEYSQQFGSGEVKSYEVTIKNPFDTSNEEARKIYNEEFLPYAIEKSKGDKRYEPLKEGEKVPFTTADLLYVFLRKSKREGKDFGYDGVTVDERINGEYSQFPLDRSQVKEVSKSESKVSLPSTVKSEEGKGVTDEKLLNNPTPNNLLKNIDEYSKSQLREILKQNDPNGDYNEATYDELKQGVNDLFSGGDFDAMNRQVKVKWLNIPTSVEGKIVEGGFVDKAKADDIAKIEKYSGIKMEVGATFMDTNGEKYKITKIDKNGDISFESLEDNEDNYFNGKNTIKSDNQNIHSIIYKAIESKSETKPIQNEVKSEEVKLTERQLDNREKKRVEDIVENVDTGDIKGSNISIGDKDFVEYAVDNELSGREAFVVKETVERLIKPLKNISDKIDPQELKLVTENVEDINSVIEGIEDAKNLAFSRNKDIVDSVNKEAERLLEYYSDKNNLKDNNLDTEKTFAAKVDLLTKFLDGEVNYLDLEKFGVKKNAKDYFTKKPKSETKPTQNELNQQADNKDQQGNEQAKAEVPNVEPANKTIEPTSEGTGEPPKITPIEGETIGDGEWASVRKEKLKEIEGVKDMFEKRMPKKWSEVYKSALENVQKMYPKKSLYEAMKARVQDFVLRLNNKELFNPTSEDIAVFTTFRAETDKRINEVEGQDSDNSIVRQAANMELDNYKQDLMNIARVTNPEGEAGRAFGMHQSEAMLDENYGLKIRRMELMKSKGDEKLTPEEEKWVNDKWEQEKEIMKQEASIREQGLKEDFDNKISELQKEYEEKLKQKGRNTPQNRTVRDKTLSQKGKDIADQIRKLKIQKGETAIDVTFGLRNLAIEGVAQLVEKGATIAEAIKEVLKDVKYKGLTESELTNHIVDGLNNKKDKTEQLDKIKEFAKSNGVTDITNDMVTQNLVRDYVNSHIGEVDKKDVFDVAFKDLKDVLRNVTKEKMVEAYLKKGEFKQPTKKQLEGGIKQQENELRRIAKEHLTADQQQKIKLDLEKENTLRKQKEFKRKLADEEFEEPVPVKLKKSDAHLIKLKKEQSVIEEAYRKEQKKFLEKNKSGWERAADFARSIYIAILIGAPKTLAKVASMSITRPIAEAGTKLTFGKVFDKFFPNISKAALRGGEGTSIRSIQKGFEAYFRQMGDSKMERLYEHAENQYNEAVKAYKDYKNSNNPDSKRLEQLKNNMNDKLIKVQGSFIYKFIGGSSIKDAWNALVNRSNEIEKQFGKVEGESIKEGNWLDKLNYIAGFIGRSHSAVKTFSGRFSFAAGFMARLEGSVRNGEDISSLDKVLEIAHESYLDWERGKYQQSNQISDLWNKLTNNISEGEKGTPREGTAKVMAALLKTEVAITRVPVNILHEAVMEYTLGAFRAVYLAAKSNLEIRSQLKGEGILPNNPEFKAALKERISQMDEKQAATIARAFRKGGLGVGLYAMALISGAIHFGIFPHLGQKKKKEEEDLKPGELNPGQVMVGDNKFGEVASGIIEHIPALWTTFMGLGMAQAYKGQIDKGKSSKEAIGSAIYTHLKVIEGSIPQSKIISPSRVGETIVQSVTKKAQDAGLIDKDEYKGFTPEQVDSPVLKWGREKGIKITPPTKKYTENGEEKIMTEQQFDKYTVNRAKRIENYLGQLRQKGVLNGGTDKESYQKEASKRISQANEEARKEVIKSSNKIEPINPIRGFRPLPVRPIR